MPTGLSVASTCIRLALLRCWPAVFLLLISTWTAAPVSAECEHAKDCPTHNFRSRPDIHAPVIEIDMLRPELTTPGYIFLAPYHNKDPGPYIYDNYGSLVWSASGQSGPKTAHDPHVCKYKGEDHICFFQGQQHQGFARGHGTIMDNTYRIVAQVESAGSLTCSDMHEFRLAPYTDGRTALMSVYHTRAYDLTTNPHFLIKNGMGWVVDGVFQEINVETGELAFEWRSMDHLDPSLSYTYPGTTDTSGSGLSEWSPWDYFHLNSIDKNEDGDYLVSARHMWAIYKLSGVDGHVIWQLGGKNATYQIDNLKMAYQHHARWMSENGTHTVISLFDNGSNGFDFQSESSTGQMVVINHITGNATAIQSWTCPLGLEGIQIGSQGSMQVLDNGNAFLGWGEWPWFSEHNKDGSPVQFGRMKTGRIRDYMNYRTSKFNWTGMPIVNPALWTYALSNDTVHGMAFYSSWNGATEVESWTYYTSDNVNGPYEHIGSARRDGFETVSQHTSISGWAYTEALDKQGRVLGRSEIAKTFIPSAELRPFCNEFFCASAERERENNETTALPQPGPTLWSSNRGFNTSGYYAIGASRVLHFLHDSSHVDIGSLVLGMTLSAIMSSMAIALYYAMRKTLPRGVLDRMRAWLNTTSRPGKYSRISASLHDDGAHFGKQSQP